MSDEYFKELENALVNDPKWNESTRNVKTSILIGVTDMSQTHLLGVENGITTVQRVSQDISAEFTFDGSYDAWCKVAKGELDMQSAVLKGQLRFKGSITKILMYRERFVRIADLMKNSTKEY